MLFNLITWWKERTDPTGCPPGSTWAPWHTCAHIHTCINECKRNFIIKKVAVVKILLI